MPPFVAIARPSAPGEADSCWIPAATLEETTGWALKPEGLCRGASCTPIPPGREREFLRDAAVDFGAFARHMDLPTAREGDTWAFGEPVAQSNERLASSQAPGFVLPDLEGKLHSLVDYRGRKVFLVSWASW